MSDSVEILAEMEGKTIDWIHEKRYQNDIYMTDGSIYTVCPFNDESIGTARLRGPTEPQEAASGVSSKDSTGGFEYDPEALIRAQDIPQCVQYQGSLTDQLRALRIAAVKLGFYDADDYLAKDGHLMKLTDRETAVIIDMLSHFQNASETPTPTIDSALKKINSLMTPRTNGLRIEANDA